MRPLRPILRCHSNNEVLFSHSRDIKVYVYKNNLLKYDIPLYFQEEKQVYPRAFSLQFVIKDLTLPLLPVQEDEYTIKYTEQLK